MRGLLIAGIAGVMASAVGGCAREASDGEASSESFIGSAGTVVGGKDGVRTIDSATTNGDAIALADGSAVTPLDARYDEVAGQRMYVYHALEFVGAGSDRSVRVDTPLPFIAPSPGPDGSALVVGFAAAGRELHLVSPSSPPRLVAKGDIGGATTATDGSIVWIESGSAPKLHRLRGGSETAVPIAKDPFERTFASCRTFLRADAERVYDVCISGFTLEPSDEVQRVRVFAADGSLESEIGLKKEPFGGIIADFDGGGRLLVLDTAYTGDGDKNVGVHGHRYDPKTRTATVIDIPVFPHTERWRPRSIIPTADGGCLLPGNANERFAMVKLLADGTLDRAFDEDGAMSADAPDDWGVLLAGRMTADGARVDLLGYGAKRTESRAYRLAIQVR